jgi:hypothetical protein
MVIGVITPKILHETKALREKQLISGMIGGFYAEPAIVPGPATAVSSAAAWSSG